MVEKSEERFRKKKDLLIISPDKIFYFAFSIRFFSWWLLSSCLGDALGATASYVLTVINAFVVILLVVKIIFFQEYSLNLILCIVVVSMVTVISFSLSKENDLLILWIFVLASQGIDIKNVATYVVKMLAFIIPMLSILSFLGLIENTIFIRDENVIRYGMGYTNPNTMGSLFLEFCVAWTIVREQKYKIWDTLLFCGILLVNNLLVDCRTASILIVVLMAFNTIFLSHNIHSKLLLYIYKLTLFFVPVVSVFFTIYFSFSNYIVVLLNDFTSWRLYYAHKYYEMYGFSILGHQIEGQGAYLDNAYIHGMIIFGILPTCIYILAWWLLIRKGDCRISKVECICIIVSLFFGLMEARIYDVSNNFIVILFGKILYESDMFKGKIIRIKTRMRVSQVEKKECLLDVFGKIKA